MSETSHQTHVYIAICCKDGHFFLGSLQCDNVNLKVYAEELLLIATATRMEVYILAHAHDTLWRWSLGVQDHRLGVHPFLST